MLRAFDQTTEAPVLLANPDGSGDIVFVCEHASPAIPAHLHELGLTAEDRYSHAVWDPGALAVAQALALRFDAPLVAGGVSRLVYDCNRPPEAPSAMPAQSERIAVPGNLDLDAAARAERVVRYYVPFRDALAAALDRRSAPVLVTLHSFTPLFHGAPRAVEIGVLHDRDTRLADALLADQGPLAGRDVQRNAPYGPDDGVTHTLQTHALPRGCPNVMLEIRNDLVDGAAQTQQMAGLIGDWLALALARMREGGTV